jgi:GntR family transcriptional repressor for pyruvate dehydrogenase complex
MGAGAVIRPTRRLRVEAQNADICHGGYIRDASGLAPPMTVSTNPPRLRSEGVHDRLRRAILSGRYVPGETLPSERTLSDTHRVDRSAVREAVKRLAQAGLVEVSTAGTSARVLDWRTTGGLELLADLAGTEDINPLLRSVTEMRAAIGADAARLCAERAPAGLRDELRQLGAALVAPADRPRYLDRFEAYDRLWATIVHGSGNLAYRLAYNTLMGAGGSNGVDPKVFAGEVDDPAPGRELADAVARGDGARAEAVARDLLQRSVRAVGG